MSKSNAGKNWREPVTRSLLIAILMLFAFSPFSSGGQEEVESWWELYDNGVRLIQEGRPDDAIRSLEGALAIRSEEGLLVSIGAGRYLDYLPHIYLAVAQHMVGNVVEARHHLALAEASGMAARSDRGRPLFEAYQQLLEPHQNTNVVDHEPLFRRFERRPVVLSEEEYERLMSSVARRCRVETNGDLSVAPWYLHYELGLELERRGDPQRALDAILAATERRRLPKLQTRMYGMWFIDYVPYFEIAKLHMELQNFSCARDAMELSERLGEVPAGTELYGQWTMVRDAIMERKTGVNP